MKFYFDHLKVFKYSIKLLLVSTILLKFNFAGNNNIRFEHLGLEDGLSQVSVFCILQDDQGFMWFGTQD
ncbi:MAG: hypothetical protein KAR38_15305, partial [Calditrichia bacterium]|nr:hypothetical protein [Calditrichia bacterium]